MSTVSEAARRRTFAIISHPDAGKTTLTEKLLLFGGAIHLAGEVKARGAARRARSDWMKIEQERGISVTTAVMTFQYEGHTFNLLDARGVISVTERQAYIGRVRALAKRCADLFVTTEAATGDAA